MPLFIDFTGTTLSTIPHPLKNGLPPHRGDFWSFTPTRLVISINLIIHCDGNNTIKYHYC